MSDGTGWRARWATALDRLNVRVVRWRLGQDPDAAIGLGTAISADAIGQHTPDGGQSALVPVAAERSGRGAVQRWRSADSDWVADRLPVPGGRPAAAVILLHGWLATPAHLWYLRQRVRPLQRAGVEIWMPRLPAHIERTPAGSVSGVRCLAGPTLSTVAAIEGAVRESIDLGQWLRQRLPHVGIWGISLGGWVAAVTATREPAWSAVVLWSPVVDPRDALLSSPLARPLREIRERVGDREIELGADHDRLVPIERPSLVRREDVLVISGVYDNVARRQSIESLCTRWQASCVQLEHGHISQMMSLRAWRQATKFVFERTVHRADVDAARSSRFLTDR